MHGPYTASISIDRSEPVLFTEDELKPGTPVVHRYYQDASVGCVDGALKAAVLFAAAELLEPGHEAEVEILGYVGGEPVVCRRDRARRDERGRFLTTLGSRFNERMFRGV